MGLLFGSIYQHFTCFANQYLFYLYFLLLTITSFNTVLTIEIIKN